MAKTTKTKADVAKPDSYPGQHLQLDPQKLLAWKKQISEAIDADPDLAERFSISPEGVRSYLTLNRQVNRKFVNEATEITKVPIPDGLLTTRPPSAPKPAAVRRPRTTDEITKVQLSDVDADRFTSTLLENGFEAYRDRDQLIIIDPTSQDDGDLLVEVVVRRVVHATRTKGQLKLTEPVAGEVEIKPLGRIESTR